ncbi:tyrosine-protein phosphatase non-receptor type substrate 1-like [Macrotis lagotis]|uniref:tyrosine-protein phosphatase non-receptor type substrate 1-like n=1 Tax=Macrotis lagotis TaxID=92651 RepID=UPI003D69747B
MPGPPNMCHLRFGVWILLITLSGSACMDKKAQKNLEVEQPWGPLQVMQGSSAILPCVLTNDVFVGPTKWFKGKGLDQQLIYSDEYHTSARVQRVSHSWRNMTILISNITTQDEGVYYFNPSPTLVAGQMMTFTCTSLGFYNQQVITITWFKDGKKADPLQRSFSSSQNNNFYNITSMVQVPFTGSHVQSQVICEVQPKLSTSRFQTLKPRRDEKYNSLSSRGPLTTAAPTPFPTKKTQLCNLILTGVFLGWKILLLVILSVHYIFRRRSM